MVLALRGPRELVLLVQEEVVFGVEGRLQLQRQLHTGVHLVLDVETAFATGIVS